MESSHVPVLVEETVSFLEPQRGGTFVDCTVGLGGHAEALLERGPAIELVGIDRDPEALEIASERLARFGARVVLVEGRFDALRDLVSQRGISRLAGVLADLGVSSLQVERAERGFSFRREGPLDMRMGRDSDLTAADVINRYSEGELEKIFRDYGEERQARRIARAVVEARRRRAFSRTTELRDLIHRVHGRPRPALRSKARIDPATRVFQALRIEVNQELAGLKTALDQALELLDSDGRLVVISYHSLEDRIVKTALRRASVGEIDPVTGRRRSETVLIELLTRKPVRPSAEEVARNPRARSARLRAARRLDS